MFRPWDEDATEAPMAAGRRLESSCPDAYDLVGTRAMAGRHGSEERGVRLVGAHQIVRVR